MFMPTAKRIEGRQRTIFRPSVCLSRQCTVITPCVSGDVTLIEINLTYFLLH